MLPRLVPILSLVALTLGRPAYADAPHAPSKTAKFKGVFESAGMTEIALHLEGWLPQSGGVPIPVLHAVAPGRRVKKGETLVTLDTRTIDQALRDLDMELRGAKLTLEQAEMDVRLLERSITQEIQAAERAHKVAAEDLKRFLDEDKPFAEKTARQKLEEAQFQLEYAKEDLRQLEKMYRANDLTGDNEKMVLTRNRRNVKRTAFKLETAQREHDRTLQIGLPRMEADLREATSKTALALDKARSTLPWTLAQKRQDLSKAHYECNKLADKRKLWQKDRSALKVTAPMDGIVYYGRCVQGQWSTTAEMSKKLQRGGALGAEEVFMTIVQSRPIFVRATVEEKDLSLVAVGVVAQVTALVLPDQPLPAKAEQMSAVPLAGGQYDVRLTVELSDHAEKVLLPGMTCTVKVTATTQP